MRPNTSANIASASAAVDQAGIIIPADFVYKVSAQAVVTGTSTGTLNIQASNDLAVIPTIWSNIATVGTVAIAGAGTYLIPQFDVSYRFLRASFVHTNAAAGTINVNIHTTGF